MSDDHMSDDNRTPAAGQRPEDHGFSLVDVVVATSIMSVVMVMAAGAIMEIYSNVKRTDGMVAAKDQLGTSFRRLDKELRYATWVSSPGQVSGAWYLEWAASSGCQQLVFKNGVLTRRTWTPPSTTPSSPAAIASGLTQTGTVAPFTVYAPGDRPYASASPNISGVGAAYELEHAQVRLRFNASSGVKSLPLDVLFTAQNTNRNTSALNDCSKGRPTA